ncbi:MAG: hypothetical protein ACD_45C00253G0004 [uncultured bacterium]|nr:MAG: hypothetical protein ACD_45C00253G0004 [uncultured bacterium]
MQLGRYLLIIFICLMLLACASTKVPYGLWMGKASFRSGDYKEAFHQLLPVAVSGQPEAQYAIGYMYYYGYGVPQDYESGIFWMNQAAKQHYPPAVKALNMIQQQNREMQKEKQNDSQWQYRQASQKDEVLNSLQTEPKPPMRPAVKKTKIAFVPQNKLVLSNEVALPSTQHYSLQLFGSYNLTSVKALQLQLKLKNTGHVYQTTRNDKTWYVLTFGNFVTAHEAHATQPNLPSELRAFSPWVRSVDALRLI